MIKEIGCPVVRPSKVPDKISTSSFSFLWEVYFDWPGFLLSRNDWISSSLRGILDGTPSITHPIAFEADVAINGVNFSAEAKIRIDRTKWGIQYGSGSFFEDLGDKMILDEIAFEIFLLSVK